MSVKSTSFSRTSDFEKCPFFFKLRHIEKIKDPRPLDSTVEHPLDRGTRIHTLAEKYVENPLLRLPTELAHHAERFDALRVAYEKGMVTLEMPLAFDKHWRQSASDDFKNTIYRMIADVVVQPTEERILIVDHKTGKKKGNEIKHHQQLMEYAVGFSLVYADLQLFDTQIWYLDQPEGENVMKRSFTRTQVSNSFNPMRERHEKVLNAKVFPATPSQFACLFCPYKAGVVGRGKNAYPGTGHCRKNIC